MQHASSRVLSRFALSGAAVIATMSFAVGTASALPPNPPHRSFEGFGTSEAAAYNDAVAKAAAASYGQCTLTSAADPHPGYWNAFASCVQILN